MTTGTVHSYDPSRGTGTITCDNGARFPFSLDIEGLNAGERVTFIAFGGRTGIYALQVNPIREARPHARIHTLAPAPALRHAA